MNQANLLLLNVGSTIARMAVSIFLGLLATRLLFRSLGEVGFANYAVSYALIAFILLLVDAINLGAQRHIAFAIGEEDWWRVHRLVGTSVTIAIGYASMVIVVCWLFASQLAWFAGLAPGRDSSSTIVWVGVVQAAVVLLAPIKTYLIARQSIAIVSAIELLQSIGNLAAAAALVCVAEPISSDYAFFMALTTGLLTALVLLVAMFRFPETRPCRPIGLRELSSYTGWMMVAGLAWRMRTQGGQVVAQQLCGPAATTAFSVGFQLSMYQNNLAMAVTKAARPAITTSQGSGNHDRVRSVALASSKLLSLTTLLFTVPVFFETETALRLWLGEATPEMVVMARLTLVWMSFKDLAAGHLMAAQASGRLAKFACPTFVYDLFALLGAAWIIGPDNPGLAWVLPASAVVSVVCQALTQVWVYGSAAGLSFRVWLSEIVGRYLLLAGIGSMVALAVQQVMPPGTTRLMTLGVATTLVTLIGIWSIGLSGAERRRIVDLVATTVGWLKKSRP